MNTLTAEMEPIYSALAGDPDLGELVAMYVSEMPDRIAALEQAAASGDSELLRRAAHQMKGAAGSYGFDSLTMAAAVLECAIRGLQPQAVIQQSLDDLLQLCRRIRAGMPRITTPGGRSSRRKTFRPRGHSRDVRMPGSLNKVLIADDDPAILRILAAYLRAGGYEVFSASNGRQALELLDRHQPSYLITDWDMPEINGIELCRRARHLDLPGYVYIVFLTGRTGQDDLMSAMDAGADDFLHKPVRKDELLARLSAGARFLELESRLSQLATHDGLTELPTRRAFNVLLTKEWERSHRYRLPLSAVMLDIDFFKQINDTHGHLAGDEVIRVVVRLLRQHSRKSDILCRYGGEEFVALLPETDEISAALWAERLRLRIAEESIPIGKSAVQVTVSLGVTEMLADMEDKDELVSLVDQCLLAAKEQGRNRVVSLRALTEGCGLSREDLSPGGATRNGIAGDRGLKGIVARDAMIPLVHFVGPDWTVAQAANYFLQFRISSVPVTDAAGELVGIISEKDVLGIAHTPLAPDRHVDEVMRSNVITYDETAPLAHVLGFLTRAPVRSVIITAQGKPTGLISRAAILRWFLENRWNIPRAVQPAPQIVDASDATRDALATQLVDLASELRRSLQTDPIGADPAPLVGGASRMQQLLDDLQFSAPYSGGPGHGLPF